jgi:cell division protein FtsB
MTLSDSAVRLGIDGWYTQILQDCQAEAEQAMTNDELSREVEDLRRRVQQLEAERNHRSMAIAERNYRTLHRDTEAPGAALGVREQEDDGA